MDQVVSDQFAGLQPLTSLSAGSEAPSFFCTCAPLQFTSCVLVAPISCTYFERIKYHTTVFFRMEELNFLLIHHTVCSPDLTFSFKQTKI
jgi:hypothetical protein